MNFDELKALLTDMDLSKILLQPLVLLLRKAGSVVAGGVVVLVPNVAHSNDVGISTVEREVDWTECALELALCFELSGAAMLIWNEWTRATKVVAVVITHNLEDWESYYAWTHCLEHQSHIRSCIASGLEVGIGCRV